jgi:hypothetical protein
MTRSTPTLTQSGLLAVLLQRQHYEVIQLAWRRAHRKHMLAVLWRTLTWPMAGAYGSHSRPRFAPSPSV